MGIFDRFKKTQPTQINNTLDEVKETSKEIIETEESKYKPLLDNHDFKFLISYILELSIETPKDLEQFPTEFLDRCLNKEFLNFLTVNDYKLTKEIFEKIINNTLSFYDLSYDEIFLIDILPNSPEISALKNRNLELDYNYSYVVLEGNNNLSSDIEEKDIYIDSYIEDKKIFLRKEKYAKSILLYDDFDIKIINRSNDNLFEEGYLVEGSIINEDSIILLTFEKYKELCKNEEAFKILQSHKFIITDNYEETRQLDNLDIDFIPHYRVFDYEDTDLIKFNHLIKIIKESNLSESEKKNYLYRISKNSDRFELIIIIEELVSKIDKEDIDKITNAYNELDSEEKLKPIEKVSYSIEIFKYRNPNFDQLSLSNKIERLLCLWEDELKIVIKDPTISSIFEEEIKDRKDLVSLKTLLEKIEAIEKNDCIRDFLKRQGMDTKEILNTEEYELKSEYDINPILAQSQVLDETEEEDIFIGDIVGFEQWHLRGANKNIVDNFSSFYQTNGDGYHTRANSMLEFKDGKEAMEKLKNSFSMEPLKLEKYDDQYIIGGNGLHRTILLRFFYVKDLLEGKLSEEELRERYTVPRCRITTINIEKSYYNFLLKELNLSGNGIFKSKDNIHDLTITYKYKDDKQMTLEEIKEMIKKELVKYKDHYISEEIQEYYREYPSFREFMNTNFPEYVKTFNESEEINDEKRV